MKTKLKIVSYFFYFVVIINISAGQDDVNLQKAKDVLYYMNLARTNPAGFANDNIFPRIKESREADECFDEMVRLLPGTELIWSEKLYSSAFDHAKDIGSNGLIGHTEVTAPTLQSVLSAMPSGKEHCRKYLLWFGEPA